MVTVSHGAAVEFMCHAEDRRQKHRGLYVGSSRVLPTKKFNEPMTKGKPDTMLPGMSPSPLPMALLSSFGSFFSPLPLFLLTWCFLREFLRIPRHRTPGRKRDIFIVRKEIGNRRGAQPGIGKRSRCVFDVCSLPAGANMETEGALSAVLPPCLVCAHSHGKGGLGH